MTNQKDRERDRSLSDRRRDSPLRGVAPDGNGAVRDSYS